MTLAPSYSSPIPFPVPARAPALAAAEPALALSVESATVDVGELVDFAARLHAHAARDGESVSARSIVAKAFLVASLRHPGVDARWPVLPARHGLRLSELTAALDGADAASPIPDDAAVLSVGAIETDRTLSLTLAFDPRRTDAVAAHRLVEEFASLLADPWELIAHC
jgi:pyruvate/2-oxoglutarate dehydrogenase complex dihydrolipoamide acyltransferase (E2) component